jgi:hypothetical protein
MSVVRQMTPLETNPEQFAQEVARIIKSIYTEKPLTAKEAADHLNLKYRTFMDRVRDGKYPKEVVHKDRISGEYYFFPSELNQYLKSL